MIRHLAAATLLATMPVLAVAESHEMAGDAANGEKVFRKCMACHDVGPDATNKVGPILNGVIGRGIAGLEDYTYSDALIAIGEDGRTWTPEELDAFLEKPRGYAAGTKMSFAGLRKEEERADVIAYLATFSEENDSGS